MIIRIIIEGFSLGLSTGIYCLNACLPILLPYMFSQGRRGVRLNLNLILQFLLGRFLAYIIFAVLVSLVGKEYQRFISSKILAIALILTAVLMILYALVRNLPYWKLCQWLGSKLPLSKLPFILGFLVGINICPPFLAGMVRLLELGNVFLGVIFFAAFFMATTLYIFPLSLFGRLMSIKRLETIGNMASLIAGVWFMINGIIILYAAK